MSDIMMLVLVFAVCVLIGFLLVFYMINRAVRVTVQEKQ